MSKYTRRHALGLFLSLLVIGSVALLSSAQGQIGGGQKAIASLEDFPHVPTPFRVHDWTATSRDYEHLIFHKRPQGLYLPLLRRYPAGAETRGGSTGPRFGLPSYVGAKGGDEALDVLGAVLGGSLAGVDETNRVTHGPDWVQMCEAYYTTLNGHGLVLNNVDSQGAGSFWYDLFPSCLFFQIDALYPGHAGLDKKMRAVADSWLFYLTVIHHDFQHTGLDFRTLQFVDKWREPDAVAEIGWLEYMAFVKFHDPRYLAAAKACLADYDAMTQNPCYEVLGFFGPALSARLNAEQGCSSDTNKMLDWVFAPTSASRPGWGCISERWGDYDAYGLLGSTTDSGGYAFSMNTFVGAGTLLPVVRYAPQYSRTLGRWLLAVASNASLFYPVGLPPGMQSNADWVQQSGVRCIPYEGVRHHGLTTPYATGDAWRPGRPGTNFSLYSAWSVGYLGAVIARTNVPEILRLDCLATDFFHAPADPTFLYYNPLTVAKVVTLALPRRSQRYDIYDAVTQRFLARRVTKPYHLTLPADQAAQIILVPSGGKVMRNARHQLTANGIIIDYRAPAGSSVSRRREGALRQD